MAKAKKAPTKPGDRVGLHLLTIARKNFNGPACGFTFKKSICAIDLQPGLDQLKLRRLEALFHGSKVEAMVVKKDAPAEVAEDAQDEVDLDSMDRDVLKQFIKDEGLGIKVKDLNDDQIRLAIVAELEKE